MVFTSSSLSIHSTVITVIDTPTETLKVCFSIQNSPFFGPLSCLIEQWHIFLCSVIWVLGRGGGSSLHQPTLIFPRSPPPTYFFAFLQGICVPAVPSPVLPLTWCRRGPWIHTASGMVSQEPYRRCLLLAGGRRHSNSSCPAEYRQSIPLVSLHEAVQHPPTW